MTAAQYFTLDGGLCIYLCTNTFEARKSFKCAYVLRLVRYSRNMRDDNGGDRIAVYVRLPTYYTATLRYPYTL